MATGLGHEVVDQGAVDSWVRVMTSFASVLSCPLGPEGSPGVACVVPHVALLAEKSGVDRRLCKPCAVAQMAKIIVFEHEKRVAHEQPIGRIRSRATFAPAG